MATHQDLVNYYFDLEAVDLLKGAAPQHYMGSADAEFKKRHRLKRGTVANITEFYGQIEGDPSKSTHIVTPFYDGDDQLKSLIDDIEIEFDYVTENGQKRTLTHQQILDHINGQENQYIKNMQGKFRTADTEETKSALRKLIATDKHNPTRGMYGVGVAQIGSTLNRGLAENIFHTKIDGPNVKANRAEALNAFLDHILEAKTQATADGKTLAVSAWNASYDMKMLAQHIDELAAGGETDLLHKFEKIFGDYTNIKVVEASDKYRDVMFEISKRTQARTHMNLNHKKIQEDLHGQNKNIQITEVKRSLSEGLQESKYIKTSDFMHSLAQRVAQGDPSASVDDIAAEIITRIDSQSGRAGYTDFGATLQNPERAESKVVKAAAELLHSLIDPSEDISITETLRRSIREIENIGVSKKANEIMKRAFMLDGQQISDESVIVRALSESEPGTASHIVERHLGNALGGTLPDFMGGFSLSSGNTGLLGSIMTAKDNYLETINTQPQGPLKDIFDLIDTDLRPAYEQLQKTGGHSASIDVNNMQRIITNVLDNALEHVDDHRVQEFMTNVHEENIIQSSQETLDKKYLDFDTIDEVIRGRVGALIHRTPEEIMDSSAKNLSGASSVLGSVENAFNTKTGVLAKSALVLSGLVLISNRNGEINNQGSKYNTIDGISPSGDTLLHSFGSGNDKYSNQAIANLQYNFDIGSSTLRASMLGYRGDQLINNLLGRSSFDDYANTAERGNIIHKIIEQEYLQKDLAQNTEHFIHSAELDIAGHVDIILNSGAPLEIKTVEDFAALKRLNAPKEHHVSQANFYAYALNQPYALIGYAARNDPTKIKYFKVNTDIKRVMDEAAYVKSTVSSLRTQGHSVVTYSAYQQMQDTFRSMTQNKYSRNPGVFTGMQNGMVHSPERDNHYSAIKGLGDYKIRNKNTNVFRGTHPVAVRHKNRNRSSEGRGPSGNKTSHLFAGIIQSSPGQSTYHPGSRAERTAMASSY